ncbi:MAG TPA: hypothetical protein DEF45_18885, partial [Rhodopirellula sp.]|nr:hypothetical protein [Rhodopirellula sp.]
FTVASTHANNTVLNTLGGADTVHVQTTAGNTVVNTGAGPDTANVRTIDAKTTINTGDDDDTINVGSKAPASSSELKGISSELVINGQLGDDTLNIDDRGNTDPAKGQIKTRSPTEVTGFEMAGVIRHETVEAVNLTAGDAGTTLLIDGTAAYSVTNVWAGDGPDVINVRNTGGAVNLRLQSGDDFVNIGSEAPGIDGTLNQIGDLITVHGGSGLDVLNLDDTSDAQANNGVLTNAKITGLGMGQGVSYSELESLEISLGQGDDSVSVTGAMVGGDIPAVSALNTGGGADKVTVELALDVDGAFALNAQSGEDDIDASKSTAPLVIFGGADADTILSGMGPDLLIGDRGVVDYRDEQGQLIRRLGIGLEERTVYDAGKAENKLDVPSQQTASSSFAMRAIEIRDLQIGGNDTISGGDGPDLILGGKEDDDISGGDDGSRDIILGDSGDLVFDPQGRPIKITSSGHQNGGADTIDAGNGTNYVIGGDSGDTIVGSSGLDLVLGDNGSLIWDTSVDPPVLTEIRSTEPEFGGDDVIKGGDGTDVILAGAGGDVVDAGTDNSSDFAVGDHGYALFDGQGRLIEIGTAFHQYGGDDDLTAADGRDYLIGGAGSDEVTANGGEDVILGDTARLVWSQEYNPPLLVQVTTPSEDTAHGGDDTIDAGGGNDLAFGGTGSDTIYGRSGDDVLSNYQANFRLPLPAMPSFSGWGNQQAQQVWDQPLSLFATENFTPLNAGGDSSLGTGDLVPSNNQIFGGVGDDFYLIVPGGQDTIDEGVSSEEQLQSPSPMAGASESSASPDLSDTFRLHSWPSAAHTIYLDFDGHVTEGTTWNTDISRIVSPAYDPEGDGANFTDSELSSIRAIWKRISEDFSPFEVNVTTEDPGAAALSKGLAGDDQWGVRVVITEDWASCGCGGLAYLDSFNDRHDEPVFVFNKSEVGVSAASSHEVGHALGLIHDGTSGGTNGGSAGASHDHDDHDHSLSVLPLENSDSDDEYYNGHGTGEMSWGPIMGSGYYANVTTFDTGAYDQATNQEDDWHILTTHNGFGYREDDHGATRVSATSLEPQGLSHAAGELFDVRAFGVISEGADEDWFEFEMGAGAIDFKIDSYVQETFVSKADGYGHSIESTPIADQGSNLNVLATIYDKDLNVVATSDPELGLSAEFSNVELAAGLYYLAIEGAGYADWTASPPIGFDGSVSRGQYLITGTVPVFVAAQSNYDTVSFQTSDRGITFDPDRLDAAQYVVDPVGQNANAAPVTVRLVRTEPAPERSVYENVIGTAYNDLIFTDTLSTVRTFKGGGDEMGGSGTVHGDELRVRTYGNGVTDNGHVLSVSGAGSLMHYEFETMEWMDSGLQIHDDGDFTFSYQGTAFRDANRGYGGDSLRTYRRKEGRGTWTLGGLSSGKYLVSTTAPSGSTTKGLTRFEVLDSLGNSLVSDEHTYAGADFEYGEVEWLDISQPAETSDHTLIVSAYAAALTQVSYMDAISIERMRLKAPEIRITDAASNVNLLSGASEVDFGLASFGDKVVREFEIKNLGDEDLVINLNQTPTSLPYRHDPVTGAVLDRLAHMSVPVGYEATFLGSRQISPGGTTTLRLELVGPEPGLYQGTFALETNDVNESIFKIDVSGSVDRSKENLIYADNGSRRETPEYFSVTQGKAFAARVSKAFGGYESRLEKRGSNQVTWSWDDLDPGVYRIATTWYGNTRSAAPDAPFSVTTTSSVNCQIEGSCGTQSTLVNQQVRPGEIDESFHEVGVDWVTLFERVTVGDDGELSVSVDNSENGRVYADAIRVEPLGSDTLQPRSELRISDLSRLHMGGTSTMAEVDPFLGEVVFGATQMGSSLTRTLRFHNDGLSDLVLLDVPSVTSGFTLTSSVGEYPKTVRPGEAFDLDVRLDALNPGAVIGKLSLRSGDTEYPVISVDLQGEVNDELKLDNADRYGVHPDGYTQVGKFSRRRSSTSHDGTYAVTGGRAVGAQASWTLDEVESGWYAVYSTWYSSRNYSKIAQYDITSGSAAVQVVVDQSQKPNDLHGDRAPWELLTHIYVDTSSVNVTLTDTDDRRSVVADAVRLQRIHQPRVSMVYGDTKMKSGHTIDFGQVTQGDAEHEVFEITNDSEMPLLVESVPAVPDGFAVIDFEPTYLNHGESLTLKVRQTAESVGNFDGLLAVATSDPQHPIMHVRLKGEVLSDALVLDDRDVRFEKTGMLISMSSTRRGWHGSTIRIAPTNRVETTGAWVLEGLDPGRYNIGVTWGAYSRTATNVPVTVSGGAEKEVAHHNQQILPAEYVGSYHDRGSDWVDVIVDYNYSDTTKPLRVEISN